MASKILPIKISIIYFTSSFGLNRLFKTLSSLINLFVIIYDFVYFLQNSRKIIPILTIINPLWRESSRNEFAQHFKISVNLFTLLYVRNYTLLRIYNNLKLLGLGITLSCKQFHSIIELNSAQFKNPQY